MLLETKKKQNKFIITMVIVIACATMVCYGSFSILDTYFFTTDSVSQNILFLVIIIGIISVIMFILIPKESTVDLMKTFEGAGMGVGMELTPEQQLQDMIDDDIDNRLK